MREVGDEGHIHHLDGFTGTFMGPNIKSSTLSICRLLSVHQNSGKLPGIKKKPVTTLNSVL